MFLLESKCVSRLPSMSSSTSPCDAAVEVNDTSRRHYATFRTLGGVWVLSGGWTSFKNRIEVASAITYVIWCLNREKPSSQSISQLPIFAQCQRLAG